MGKKDSISRREFLGRAAKVAAAAGAAGYSLAPALAQGANDRLNIGVIGPGGRGYHMMGVINGIAERCNVRIVAVADIYEGWRDRGVARAKEKSTRVKAYDHHLRMLEDKNVDAVFAATPEHSHVKHIVDTLAAGKDIYIEKPMIHRWREGLQVIEANKKAGRIVQVGTQRRSVDIYYQARDLVQSGAIGRVTGVRGRWHRNSKDNDPQWRYGIPEGASEENINWPEFLGNAPKVPFDLHRYFQWRCYWDYSNGPAGDLMVHQLDAINIVMGGEMPKSAVGFGNIYRFHELERSTPDTWGAILEYPGREWAPDGYMVTYTCVFSNEQDQYGEIFYGTDGTIDMTDQVLKVIPERAEVAMKAVEAKEVRSQTWGDQEHLADFFDCCRSRKQANCDEYHGHYAAAAADMAVLSHFEGRRKEWDEKHQKVV